MFSPPQPLHPPSSLISIFSKTKLSMGWQSKLNIVSSLEVFIIIIIWGRTRNKGGNSFYGGSPFPPFVHAHHLEGTCFQPFSEIILLCASYVFSRETWIYYLLFITWSILLHSFSTLSVCRVWRSCTPNLSILTYLITWWTFSTAVDKLRNTIQRVI